jgi:putative phosphoesterase
MKLFIFSDIHGSANAMAKTLDAYKKEQCSNILLLGDALYHGPRNSIENDYDTGKTIELLNSVSDNILAVRGNCDSEVDQMVLNYSNLSDYHIVFDGERKIFMTHGHIYNRYNMPPLNKGDIFASGHSHIAEITERKGIIHFNPGSISLPRENTLPSYGTYDGKSLLVKSLEGEILLSFSF